MVKRWIWTVLCIGSLAGCSGTPPGERLYVVEGKVFYKGRPAEKAIVIFHPVNDASAIKPRAIVGPDGSFRAYTLVAGDGIRAGEYDVTIIGKKKRPTRGPEVPRSKNSKEPPGIELPERYENPKTSKLHVQVTEGRNELPPFQLEGR